MRTSRLLGMTLFILLLALQAGCSTRPTNLYYTVQPGDTLYSIAWKFDREFREVAGWNAIPYPYTIGPGQKLRVLPYSDRDQDYPAQDIPVVLVKPKEPLKPTTKKTSKRTKPQARRRPVASAKRTAKRAAKPKFVNRNIRWLWPVSGSLLTTFSAKKTGRQGIDIGGKMGQKIRAAANGKVVYAGSGLIGYGKLIIIKHDDTYLSAYAHNRRLLAKENAEVKGGQVIAEMGNTGAKRTMLHFELRRNGKPVNPLRYLPKRK